jgi:hypothetical protein
MDESSIQDEIKRFNAAFDRLVRRDIHLIAQDEKDGTLYAEKMKELNRLLDMVHRSSLRQNTKASLNKQISEIITKLQLAFKRTDHRGSYNPEIAEIVANASRVLREWDHVKPTNYDALNDTDKKKLDEILQTNLPEEIAEVIITRYRHFPEEARNEYVTKGVGMEIINAFQYARRLLPQYYGLTDGRLDIPDVVKMTSEDKDELHIVLKSVLAHSLVPRTLWDSVSVMVQAGAAAPRKSIVALGVTAVALPVAVNLAPVTTAVTSAFSGGVEAVATSSVAPAIRAFILQNLAPSAATVYFTWTNRKPIYDKILSMLSIPQSARTHGDVVALFDQINRDFLHRETADLTGIPPADIANLFDAIKYISWYFKSACASQAQIASDFLRGAVSLPGNLASLCKRVVGGVGKFVSGQASALELKNMGDTVANETFETFHDTLRRLMNQPDIESRFTTPEGKEKLERHMRNLVQMDHRIFTVFSQHVERHIAVDSAQNPANYLEQTESQKAVGSPSPSRQDPEVVLVEQEPTMTGPHSEAWSFPYVKGIYQPQGTGEALVTTIGKIRAGEFNIPPPRFRKGGSTRRKAATKKQKSKKNKRQSRRKARRSSSRKAGRK